MLVAVEAAPAVAAQRRSGARRKGRRSAIIVGRAT